MLIPPFASARRRLPWLILLLIIGMMTASLVGQFEQTIEKVAVLTFFMPMIAGMTGNTGTQSFALVIRGLTSGQLTRDKYWQILRQEGMVGIIISTVCSLLILGMVSPLETRFILGTCCRLFLMVHPFNWIPCRHAYSDLAAGGKGRSAVASGPLSQH